MGRYAWRKLIFLSRLNIIIFEEVKLDRYVEIFA